LVALLGGAAILTRIDAVAAGQGGQSFSPVPLPAGVGYLDAVTCPAIGTCYAVGQTRATGAARSGLVLSLHGGTWQKTLVSGVSYLTGVSCVDATECAATGITGQSAGVVVTTTDGSAWTEPEQPPPFAALGSSASGGSWTVSCAGSFCMTVGSRGPVTGGQVWVSSGLLQQWVAAAQPPNSATGWFASVFCDQPNDCWVVGTGIWHTADGGRIWKEVRAEIFTVGAAGAGVLPDAAYFSDPMHGLVAGYGQCGGPGVTACAGGIWTTSDGGADWSLTTSPSALAVDALVCAPGGSCVATSWASDTSEEGLILTSVDGSSGWQADGTWPGDTLAGAACPQTGACVVVGGDAATDLGAIYAQDSAPVAATAPSTIATALQSPWEAFGSVQAVALSAALAAGGTLFVGFPANLFNLTFQENYAEIREWWLAAWRRLRRPPPSAAGSRAAAGEEKPVHRTPWPLFVLVIVVGALLGSLNDPSFGLRLASLATFLGIALAISVGVGITALVAGLYHRKRHGSAALALHALPAGLAIAALSVLVSRLTGFEPGYLYGVIAGVIIARDLPKHERGHVVGLTTISVLTVSIAAWFAWVPVSQAAGSAGAGFAIVLLDDLLAAIFVSGLVGTVIGMLPLQFLPGWTLKQWRREAWAAAFVVSSFLLVVVLLMSHTGRRSSTPLVTTIVLFVVFGGLSVGLREVFAQRRRRRRGETTPALGERVRQLLKPVAVTEADSVSASGEAGRGRAGPAGGRDAAAVLGDDGHPSRGAPPPDRPNPA
jgi:hypothetical protein